jgi:hypothetical protein
MHRHDPGEVYFVLHGEFAFYTEDPDGSVRRWTAGAGAVVPLDRGTPHTIRNESGADAAAFVVYAPGAPMEGFMRAAARARRRRRPGDGRRPGHCRAARHRATRPRTSRRGPDMTGRPTCTSVLPSRQTISRPTLTGCPHDSTDERRAFLTRFT